MRKILKNRSVRDVGTSGSVSVYFISITAAFVLLTALLIDFSRIAAFRKQAELAVQSGVRSVLSSFDPGLYERYGLFVRGGEDGRELFRTTAEGHWNKPEEGRSFPYLAAEWVETDVTESRPLADHEVFRRQVLEEMKYKAPVELALEFASRFRGVTSTMKEAAGTVDLLERMRKAYDRREAALDQALAAQEQAGDQTLSLLRALAPYPSVSLSGSLPAGDVRHSADAALRYSDYVSKRLEDEQPPASPDEVPVKKYTAVIAAYESGAVSLASALAKAAGRVRNTAETSIGDSMESLRQAETANDEMRTMAEQAASADSSGAPPAVPGADGEGETVDPEKATTIADIRATAKQLVLEDAFFEHYSAELAAQRDGGVKLGAQAEVVSATVANAPSSTGLESALRDAANRLQSELNVYAGNYAAGGSVIQDRRASFRSHRTSDQQRKSLEKEAESEQAGWSILLGGIKSIQGTPEERETFRKADRLSRDNADWNRSQEAPSPNAGGTTDPSEARDQAMSGSNGMLNALSDSLSGVRDSLYYSEYVHDRMSRFSPDQVKKILDGGKVPLPLESQETEYILYGFANASGNLAAAYGEIFAFRLAIRTMEGLVECRGMGHPLLILAAALVYGFRNAVLDMRMLLEKGTVPLSKYLNADTTYEDYLRLFLLLKGDSSSAMTRSIAVMEYRTGLNFSEAYTYVSAEGTASLVLWFFPGLMKALGRTGQLGGKVKGNRYEAEYTAESSYQ